MASDLEAARERLRQAIAEVAHARTGQTSAVTDYVLCAVTISMDGGEDGYLTEYPNAPHASYGLVQILEADIDSDDEDD